MKFVNLGQRPLDFEIDGQRYQVSPMGECDIPDRIAYVVKIQGIALTPMSAVEPAAKAAAADEAVSPPSIEKPRRSTR